MEAQIIGGATKNTVNGNTITVKADNEAKLQTSVTGVAAGASGTAGAAATGSASTLLTQGTTVADVENITSQNKGIAINAEHSTTLDQYNNTLTLSGGIGAGSVGLGVMVLQDSSTTKAELKNAAITHTSANAEDSVTAKNTTKGTNQVGAHAATIALGGAATSVVGVGQVENTVEANVVNTTIGSEAAAAKAFASKAENNVDLQFIVDTAAVGIGTVGAGVDVNTIDTSVVNNTSGSTVYANTINVEAVENRNIEQTAVAGSVGGGTVDATVLVTNIGTKEVAGEYGEVTNDGQTTGEKVSLDKTAESADAVLSESQGALDKYYSDNEKLAATDTKVATFDRSGTSTAEGVQVKATNTNLYAKSGGVSLKADATTNADMDIIQGSANIGGVQASVGVLNNEGKSGVSVSGGTLKAASGDVTINSVQSGKLEEMIVQSAFSGIRLNTAYAGVSNVGHNAIALNGALVEGQEVNITGIDTTGVKAQAIGASISSVSGGALIADADNNSETTINISGGSITADTATIKAERNNTVDANLVLGAVAGLQVVGNVALADDNGKAEVKVGKVDNKSAGTTFNTGTLNVEASATPKVKADMTSVSATVASASAAIARANASGSITTAIGSGNTFNADAVNIKAEAGIPAEGYNAEAKVLGIAAGLEVGAGNEATAKTNTAVTTSMAGGNEYKTASEKVLVHAKYNDNGTVDKANSTYATITKGLTELNISADNSSKAKADAYGVTVGGILGTGHNIANTESTQDTNVEVAGGDSKAVQLKALNISLKKSTDNLATAEGGSGGIIDAGSAKATNKVQAGNKGTKLKVTGSFAVEEATAINSTSKDRANVHASNLQVTAAGGSGVVSSNEITGNTITELKDAKLTSNKLDIAAHNAITIGDQYEYAIDGKSFGLGNGAGVYLYNTVTKDAVVNMDNAILNSNETMAVDANTDIDANTKAKVNVVAAIAGGASAKTENKFTEGNKINIKSSELTTNNVHSNIILSGADTVKLASTGAATIGGAIAGAGVDVDNIITKTNAVDITNSNLRSTGDLQVYAGKNVHGNLSRLELETESEVYNYSGIPLGGASADLDNKVKEANTINIGSGSKAHSVRHINMYADQGVEKIRETEIQYTNVYSSGEDSFTSSTMGQVSPAIKSRNNKITITGEAKAGVQNKVNIVIGSAGQFVTADKELLQAGGSNVVDINGMYLEGIDKDKIAIGTVHYGNALKTRYEQIQGLLADYSADKDSAAYLGYKAELDRLKILMNATIGEDNQELILDTITLPDLVASGGNITMEAKALEGNGAIIAQGSPEVKITNNTNLYMHVNDINVGDNGGQVSYNNIAVTSKDNLNTMTGANFAGSLSQQAGQGGIIKIDNTNARTTDMKVQAIIDGKLEDITRTARPDIEINGVLENPNGTIEVINPNAGIVIQGKNANESARVSGKEVSLTAKSITQGFTDGIVNVGGSVQEQYKSTYDTMKTELDNDHADDTSATDKKSGSAAANLGGNMIAGETIFINAETINVNGKIQAGYGDYKVKITDAAQSRITALDKAYGNKKLTDAEVINDRFRVVAGGNAEENGAFVKYLDVYYNPTTKRLLIPDIDAKTAGVYLSGRIASTGGGSIKVLSGVYDVNINNALNKDLQLGKVVINDVNGVISITDTGKNTITEIYRDKTIVKNINRPDEAGTTFATGSVYSPQSGLRYNWTTGKNVGETTTYEYTKKAGLWGAVTTMESTEQADYEKEENKIDFSSNDVNKPNGEFVGKMEGAGTEDFVVLYNKKEVSNSRSETKKETWTTGFLNWFKWCRHTWTVTTGTDYQYVASVKADNNINIGFVGKAAQDGQVNINSVGNVFITNDIGNRQVYGTNKNLEYGALNINSSQGMVNQLGGELYGAKVDITALKDINNINVIAGKNFDLYLGEHESARARALPTSRNISAKVGSVAGTTTDIELKDIVAGADGTIKLETTGNITQADNTMLTGKRIDLVSTMGSVGSTDKAIKLNATSSGYIDPMNSMSNSVNVTARNNINIEQVAAGGDLRIGTIKSDLGDVKVTVANGKLVDALPYETVDRGTADEMIAKWKQLGIIKGANTNNSQSLALQQQAKERYVAGVRGEFTELTSLRSEYAALSDADKAKWSKLGQMNQLEGVYGGYTNADEYLANNANAKATMETFKVDNLGWDQNALLYAIQDGIVNPSSATAFNPSAKDANIIGKNITLTAQGLGTNSDTKTIINANELKLDTTEGLAKLKQIAGADASSVTYDNISKKFTINEKLPVGISTKGNGVLNLNSTEKIYIEQRDTNNPLNFDTINAANNSILINTGNGIYGNKIIGGDLTINAGQGGIGAADSLINIDLSGAVNATAGAGIYLATLADNSNKDIKVQALSSGGAITLKSAGNIISNNLANSDVQGYIRSEGGDLITLEAEGNIGTDTEGLRILNSTNDDDDNKATHLIKAKATKGSINLAGVVDTGAAGTGATALHLDQVQAANGIKVTSEDGLKVLGAMTNSGGGTVALEAAAGLDVKASVTNSGRLVTMKAGKDLTLLAGTVEGSSVALTAEEGNIALTKGLVDANSLTMNADGAITQSANHKLKAANLTAAAKTGIDLMAGAEEAAPVYNELGYVSLTNTSGDVAVGGVANGDMSISLNVPENDGVMAGNLNLVNYANDISNGMSFSGAKVSGDVLIDNKEQGGISVSNPVSAGGAAIITAAGGNISVAGAEAGDDLTITTGKGNISAWNPLSGANVDITTEDGGIDISSTVTATSGSVNIEANSTGTSGHIVASGNVTAAQNITMNAGGYLANYKALTATAGMVDLDAAGYINNGSNGTITAGTDVTMNAGTNISNDGAITAGKDVALNAEGSIVNQAAVAADDNITMQAGTNLTTYRTMTATNGRVDLEAETGEAVNRATVQAKEGVSLKAKTNIYNHGSLTSKESDVTLEAETGLISNNAAITAAVDAAMTAGTDITNSGALTVGNDLTMDAGGSITNSGAAAAGNNLIMTAEKGSITIAEGGRLATKRGALRLETKNDSDPAAGQITIKDTLTSGDATDQGSTENTTLDIITNNGNIRIEADITSYGKDTKGATKRQALNILANNGNITSPRPDNYAPGSEPYDETLAGPKVKALNGSLGVKNNLGDIDLFDLFAKDVASVDSRDGFLKLYNINGDIVALATGNPDKDLDNKHTTVGKLLMIGSNSLNFEDIVQREGEDQLLGVDLRSSKEKMPTAKMNMQFNNVPNGVEFYRIWAKNADVNLANGKLYIHKLIMEELGNFGAQNMKTSVYGIPPVYDEKDSIYWYHVKAHNPAASDGSWAQWLDDEERMTDNWMNLYFGLDNKQQTSNGALLFLRNYFYVYDQRFTAVDHLLQQHDVVSPLKAYDASYNPGIGYYYRHYLYDIPQNLHSEAVNAKGEDLQVE